MCCSVLQCVAVCCSVVLCGAVCCGVVQSAAESVTCGGCLTISQAQQQLAKDRNTLIQKICQIGQGKRANLPLGVQQVLADLTSLILLLTDLMHV